MGQTFVRHAGHSEENEGIPWQGDLTLAGREGEAKRYITTTAAAAAAVTAALVVVVVVVDHHHHHPQGKFISEKSLGQTTA